MDKSNITTSEAASCLMILKSEASPITAIKLARQLNLAGNRESRRRHVRAIIEHLRKNGAMIIATMQEGYFLTIDENRWKNYLNDRQSDAKTILGQTHKQKKLVDSKGQGLLFELPRICCGVASRAIE